MDASEKRRPAPNAPDDADPDEAAEDRDPEFDDALEGYDKTVADTFPASDPPAPP